MINYSKIKENFKVIGKALVDSGKEIINGIKPKTTDDKLNNIREYIKSHPNLSKEDIIDILNGKDVLYKDASYQAKKLKGKIKDLIKEGKIEDAIKKILNSLKD